MAVGSGGRWRTSLTRQDDGSDGDTEMGYESLISHMRNAMYFFLVAPDINHV